jgi:hypothetical protein
MSWRSGGEWDGMQPVLLSGYLRQLGCASAAAVERLP